ncbi:serine hydrolase domain-containing protein [Aquimarina celericrescens]|uniref:Serine hydrolase domain-containing protein n=1 Tax=Aquimarina celericrescens TaxID=1964542 RepID=A0ABW5AV55_9FLAO|nr:serine hydrolase [Aquimarina celericrescens]
MTKLCRAFTILISSVLVCCAQQGINTYEGNWEGTLPAKSAFSFTVALEILESNDVKYQLQILNDDFRFSKTMASRSTGHITFDIDENTTFKGIFTEDKNQIDGFITSGILMYHLSLKKNQDNVYRGTWNPIMIDTLQSKKIYLAVENVKGERFEAYPFFGDQRFTGTWCGDFSKENDTLLFRDYKTGLRFKGKLLDDKIALELWFAGKPFAKTLLERSTTEWDFRTSIPITRQKVTVPKQRNDGWDIAGPDSHRVNMKKLQQLIDAVEAKSLQNIHSILIAKEGKLAFEAYFEGYNASIPHDQRSASKSISSAMIGIAIDDKIIESTDQKLYSCIPATYQYTKDPLKSKIRIKDLLTMSSGLAVDGAASEGNYQETEHWLKTVLEAPMVNEPGTHANYGSANPFLLGVCLNERLSQPMELYMDQKLLSPLGITKYMIQTENTGTTPYFGGGMYLTPRDMLKFGQLYANKGTWKGKQIVSETWVEDSFKKHTRLEDAKNKNEYGYQWWHRTYKAGGREIQSIEARGAGGQFIFVLPEMKAVAVITSGNYRNRKLNEQPENIVEHYILPALLE